MTDYNKFQENEYACKGCNKQPSHYLRVLFLNKVGYFCDNCKTSLLEDNLVEEPKEEIK